jgi:hypothetical protein
MKKHLFKIFAKKITASLLISVVFFLSASASKSAADTIYTERMASVKYIGADTESYVFNVSYNNESGDRFILRILDVEGNVLYTGSYNDKKFDKRFRLIKEGNDKISFVIKNLKDNTVQTFAIATTTQVIEDIVVTKVKE